MNRTEIEKVLPHRSPMLLVDEVQMDGEYCVSSYKVRGDEPFLSGHFPDNPIVPGVILCEIMAQGACLLTPLDANKNLPVLAGMEKVRFKKNAVPGDVITSRARIISQKANIIVIESKATTADGKICCSAQLTIAVLTV